MSQSLMKDRFYDVARLVIWGEGEESSDRKPRLVFSWRDGNPRITVYTGVKGQEGILTFPSDLHTMTTVLESLREIAEGEPGNKLTMDSLTTKYVDNKPTAEKTLVSTLHIGKSKEGIVYLSLISPGKPNVVFALKLSQWHVARDAEKNQLPDAIISKRMALGLVNTMYGIIANTTIQYTNEEYVEKGGSYQIKGNNGTGQPVKQPTFETPAGIDADELGF